MLFLFDNLVYNPLYNLLVWVYNFIPTNDFGIAIILVTIFIKLGLVSLSRKQIESQKKMQSIQPKVKEIQDKYKGDKEKQSRALMELYRSNKVNPLAGCLPLIVQLVFLIAIYRVLFNISNEGFMIDQAILYSFIENPGKINPFFMGIIDLSSVVNFSQLSFQSVMHIILVAGTAIAQYAQMKMMMGKNTLKPATGKESDFSQIMSKQMLYLSPALTLFIGMKFPAGLALYWLVSTLFMIVQQNYIQKKEKVVKA